MTYIINKILSILYSIYFRRVIRVEIGFNYVGRNLNLNFGHRLVLMRNCSIYTNNGYIDIGHNCTFNINCLLGADNGELLIGNNVLVGPNVVFRTSNHRFYKSDLIRNQGHKSGKIVVCDDVWISSSCIILPGAYISEGCVIGAGCIISSYVPPYTLVTSNRELTFQDRK